MPWVEDSGLEEWEENEVLVKWDGQREPYKRLTYSDSYGEKNSFGHCTISHKLRFVFSNGKMAS